MQRNVGGPVKGLDVDGAASSLAAEAVEGASLPLEGVDDVHGGDGLPLGVLGVGDGVADDVLKEHLEHAAGLLVDEARDTLHSSAASQTTDGRLGDALDVVAQHFAMTLGAALAESLASLSTSGHVACCLLLSRDETDALCAERPHLYKQQVNPRRLRAAGQWEASAGKRWRGRRFGGNK